MVDIEQLPALPLLFSLPCADRDKNTFDNPYGKIQPLTMSVSYSSLGLAHVQHGDKAVSFDT